MDWLDLLAVQGTLKSSSPTPQFKSINSSVLSFLYSPTLTPYMTTGKTLALTRWTFVGKVMSLLFNMVFSFPSRLLPKYCFFFKDIGYYNFFATLGLCCCVGFL